MSNAARRCSYGTCQSHGEHLLQNPESSSAYRLLLGEAAWARIHPAVRKRFDGSLSANRATYVGTMHRVYLSWAGWLLAFICRPMGTPLAPHNEEDVPMQVQVYPDCENGGLVWYRIYKYKTHAVARVRSVKRIDARNGLVECVGAGFGMALAISEHQGSIRFTSKYYFWRVGRWQLRFPHLLSPGTTQVIQENLERGQFRFLLKVKHPLLGVVFFQDGIFRNELSEERSLLFTPTTRSNM